MSLPYAQHTRDMMNVELPLAEKMMTEPILASECSRVLDEAGVPNVWWAEYMLSCYNVPTGAGGSDFVVPDDLVSTAYEALLQVGFIACYKPSACIYYDKINYFDCPFPAEHVHRPIRPWLPAPSPVERGDENVVRLHRKSHMLFAFPDIPIGAPAEDDMYYMNADSPELRDTFGIEAIFQEEVYPIKIPRLTKLFEALHLLFARDSLDYKGGDDRWASLWQVYLAHLGQYVKRTGLFKPDQLDKRFRPLFRHMMRTPNDLQRLLRLRQELRARLIRENALPPPPRPDVPRLAYLDYPSPDS